MSKVREDVPFVHGWSIESRREGIDQERVPRPTCRSIFLTGWMIPRVAPREGVDLARCAKIFKGMGLWGEDPMAMARFKVEG